MKYTLILTTLALFSAMASSCRKDNDPQQNPQAPQPQNGIVSYRIDNQYRQAAATYQSGLLTTTNTPERLELRFPASQSTFNVTTGFSPSIGVVNLSSQGRDYYSNSCNSPAGQISVTGMDQTTISGTFSGRICTTSGEIKTIENGVFTRIPAQ